MRSRATSLASANEQTAGRLAPYSQGVSEQHTATGDPQSAPEPSGRPGRPGALDRLQQLASVFWREVAKFGVIGAVAFTIDLVLFNVLFYGPMQGHLATSRIISGVVSTSFAWVGNRTWTFRHRRNRAAHHEALLFFAVNAVGLLISTGYLNATHDLLHWTSRLAVNVNNIVGIGMATLLRFYAYRTLVFVAEKPGDDDPSPA